MMKTLKIACYLSLGLLLLAACSKDKIEENTPVVPEDVTLQLSATDLVFESGGGKQEFTVSCNTEWTLANESDWCTTDVTSGMGDRTVTVTAAASSGTEDRNLNLSVTAGNKTSLLTVTEKHGNALILAKDKFDLPQDGGEVPIDVKSDVEEVVIPAECQSWISLAPDTRASQIKCYVFIILEKKGKDGRRGYIIFKGGSRSDTVLIFQAPEERLILSEDTCRVPSKGGDITVELKTRLAYEVTIPDAAASWVSRITEQSYRADRLKLRVAADSTADRNTQVVIKDRLSEQTDTLYICQTSVSEDDITSSFAPAFAGMLQRRGYIPDSTRILVEDVKGIDTLNVSGTDEDWQAGKGLTSLAGIEHFESLTYLNCRRNQLTSLEIGRNTALTTLYCSSNQLSSLDVSKNTALTVLVCNKNRLSSLEVNACGALGYLDCADNRLASLDVSSNTVLYTLSCSSNRLSSLDVNQNTALVLFFCHSNQLTSLDVSGNVELTQLICDSNQLASLDVSKNTALTLLGCSRNQLTSLDISQNPALTYLECRDNPGDGTSVFPVIAWFNDDNIPDNLYYGRNEWQYGENTILLRFQTEEDIKDITAEFDPGFAKMLEERGYIPNSTHILVEDVKGIDTLDVSGTYEDWKAGKGLTSLAGIEHFESLTKLYCYYNQLTSLDVSKNTALTELLCSFNQLTSLNVSGCTDLTYLSCTYNPLASLNVSGCIALTKLVCIFTQLTSLNVSGCTALSELWCTDNPLTSLDASGCVALTELHCYSNQLTSLDVSGCTALNILLCEYNQLTTLDVSSCTVLTGLDCSFNQLTSLNISECTSLEGLHCDENQLTSLDVSKNTALTDLYCSGNQITALNISKNTALTKLNCLYNQLTSLDVSKNTDLTSLYCYNNPGDGESLFPVTAWFDNNNIPENMLFNYPWEETDGKTWKYDGKTIRIDFRKAE